MTKQTFKIATLRTAVASLSSQYNCCSGSTITETLNYPLASMVSVRYLEVVEAIAMTPKRFAEDIADAERCLTYACAKVVRWAMCKGAWSNLPEADRTSEAWVAICSAVPMVGTMSEDEKAKVRLVASKVFSHGWEIFLQAPAAEELPPNCIPFRLKAA